MRSRFDLHEKLVEILGSRNVYFKPPATAKMSYPCFVYKKHTLEAENADNSKYLVGQKYQVTIIYSDPDSQLPEKFFKEFRFCTTNTPTYVSDNLYHDVFTIYW